LQDRFEMLHCLLDHKAKEHCFEVIDAPIFQLLIELLMRHIEKIRQLLGVKKPKKMRKGSRHKDFECDALAFLSPRLLGACCSHYEVARNAQLQRLTGYLYTQWSNDIPTISST